MKEIVTRVKVEENKSKPRPEKSTQCTPESSSQPRRKDTLATETKSPSKPQSAKEDGALSQMHANKQYSFKDEHVVSLLKLRHKSTQLKLPEERRPKEVGKIDNSNYCLYQRMLGHPMKSCYIFKDVLQALINMEELKLCPEQKK